MRTARLGVALAVGAFVACGASANAGPVRHCAFDNSRSPGNGTVPPVGEVRTNTAMPCAEVVTAVRLVQGFGFTQRPGTVDSDDRLWLVSSYVHPRLAKGDDPFLVVTMHLVSTKSTWTTTSFWIRFDEGS